MQTVVPANSTARPEVLIADDDRFGHRHAPAQVSSMSGDDEQRVVDPDADHHQLGQVRRDVRDVDGVAEDEDHAQAADQRDRRAGQRQHGRGERAEHQRQDDQRGQRSR